MIHIPMLQFSQEQIDEFLEDEEYFTRWYKDVFMPQHVPEYHHSSIRDDTKVEMISQGREYARKCNLLEASSHVHFVTMMFKIGPNFFVFPGFREALALRKAKETEIIDALYNVSSEDADRAMEGADDRYWWPELLVE